MKTQTLPRNEHPNPQFKREFFRCLNGEWEFFMGSPQGKINVPLDGKITVPFCVESDLSGVGYKDFIKQCVYGKVINLSEDDLSSRLCLHFGAVDNYCEVYLNGEKLCTHTGGYTPFYAQLNGAAKVGENRITVVVYDDVLSDAPSGKQSFKQQSFGCFYTRCTGIWQTVWLEKTPNHYVKSVRFYPDVENCRIKIALDAVGKEDLTVNVTFNGEKVGFYSEKSVNQSVFYVDLSQKHLWEIGCGNLYDVELIFGEDKVKSYFGLREVCYKDGKFLLNGKSVFQRLVLDQGYYPDGIYTAPSEQALVNDINLALNLGFNGARLHQKLFEPLYLYHCDKLGFIVWGEYASWGCEYSSLYSLGQFVSEWTEAVERDFNHPSVVHWCPLNETWFYGEDENKKPRDMRYVETIYHLTKTLDETRPCVDVSGGFHGRYTDLFDFHCYHTAEETRGYLDDLVNKGLLTMNTLYGDIVEEGATYDGKAPTNASEYGGVAFSNKDGWGYRTSSDEKSFTDEYVSVTEMYLNCKAISGFCYTQLYDVEQEQNGLYTYDRKNKFGEESIERMKKCNLGHAKIEED